ncbi:MAG: hypothetical protein ACYDD4_05010 [Acidimicrobiales bacterium]
MNTSNGLAGRVAAVVSKSARSLGGVIVDAVYALRIAAGRRNYRPWLALIVVPLAMTASALTVSDAAWPAALWLPLLIGAWWWYPGWRWGWVLAFEFGAVGTQWAIIGAYSLHEFPGNRLLIEVLWTGYAVAIAIAGIISRRTSRD